ATAPAPTTSDPISPIGTKSSTCPSAIGTTTIVITPSPAITRTKNRTANTRVSGGSTTTLTWYGCGTACTGAPRSAARRIARIVAISATSPLSAHSTATAGATISSGIAEARASWSYMLASGPEEFSTISPIAMISANVTPSPISSPTNTPETVRSASPTQPIGYSFQYGSWS